jgi:hypothetical protein
MRRSAVEGRMWGLEWVVILDDLGQWSYSSPTCTGIHDVSLFITISHACFNCRYLPFLKIPKNLRAG